MCSTPRSVVRPAGSASRAPPAPVLAAAVRVRDVVRVRGRVRVVAALTSNNGTLCACGGSAMTGGDDPRIVRNGALRGSFRPAPGDRLD